MIRIGLLSDTHGYLDEKLFDFFATGEEVWHAGDIGTLEVASQLEAFRPLRAVYGNIDDSSLRTRYPEHQDFILEDVRVWMTHIGGYPRRYPKRIREKLSAEPIDLFICGHSHILKVMPDKKNQLLHINPGAAGRQGFHHMRTAVRFTLSAGKVSDLDVIELGKRGAL
jgi:hypothetical protein